MPSECKILLELKAGRLQIIDVRSEGEFQAGHLPSSICLPILNDLERHLVGCEYKASGQDQAIALGMDLVSPHKSHRVEGWMNSTAKKPSAIMCWRGGLRSKFAHQWLVEAGGNATRVPGGYKALRNELLNTLSDPPPLIVLAGWTGSNKTAVLRKSSILHLDLELLAQHRGSCFGDYLDSSGDVVRQPSQATFENALALALYKNGTTFVEDESTRIGSLNIPQVLKNKMRQSELVLIEEPIDIRAKNIFVEYIENPLQQNVPLQKLRFYFLNRLNYLKRHLGGLAFDEIQKEMYKAFDKGAHWEDHCHWIQRLLGDHYDKAYRYSFSRLERKVIFKGNAHEVLSFLNHQFRHQPEMVRSNQAVDIPI